MSSMAICTNGATRSGAGSGTRTKRASDFDSSRPAGADRPERGVPLDDFVARLRAEVDTHAAVG